MLLDDIRKENKDQGLQRRLERCWKIVAETESYVDQSCSEESEMQKHIEQETLKDPRTASGGVMLSGKVVGQFLKMIAEMTKAKKILEIGLFTGYSAVTLAESAFCEKVTSLDIDEYAETFVKSKIEGTNLEQKIKIHIGPAAKSLVDLDNTGETFDLVYIDADKEGYQGYYEYIMDNRMLNEGGVFVCDNILWLNDTAIDRESSGGQALHEFVQFVKQDARVEQVLKKIMVFPMRDGVFLITRK